MVAEPGPHAHRKRRANDLIGDRIVAGNSRAPRAYEEGMGTSRHLLALVVLLLGLSIAPSARSAPMSTDFSMIRANAAIVALGTVHQVAGPNNAAILTVDVDKVIRGTAARGPLAVKESPDGHVSVDNERVVAIVDNAGALRWVGRLVAGASLETGVILFQGFFDFNAHIVHPGLMTLAEMQKLFATGQI